jgi:hypothetical protein
MHNLTICRTPRNNGPDDSAHFPRCAFNSADPSHLLPIVQSPPSDHTGSHQPRYISAHPSPTQVTTTMPLPYLAPEIIAHIIGNLSENIDVLDDCSLVCKSWVPHARKHLFGDVDFTCNADIQSWKLLFPNPLYSPGCYTRTLHLAAPHNITMADVEPGRWFRAFSNVLSLDVNTEAVDWRRSISLTPLHSFSPVVSSLRFEGLKPHFYGMLNLALSFPCLENLHLCQDGTTQISNIPIQLPDKLPPLTGTLDLSNCILGILETFVEVVFKLPIHLRFRRLSLYTRAEKAEVEALKAIVKRCLSTLQHLEVYFTGVSVCSVCLDSDLSGRFPFLEMTRPYHHPCKLLLDVSRVKKLASLTLASERLSPKWIINTLETLEQDQQNVQITIRVSFERVDRPSSGRSFVAGIDPIVYEEWKVLDKLFLRRWGSNAIQTIVTVYEPEPEVGKWGREWMETLVPQSLNRGAINAYDLEEW